MKTSNLNPNLCSNLCRREDFVTRSSPWMRILIVNAVLILGNFGIATGQVMTNEDEFEVGATYLIDLADGTQFVGTFIEKDTIHVTLKTFSLPKIDIPFANILRIEKIASTTMRDGVYWFPNPHSTRYLFTPSAFNLKKGEAYYQNTYLFLNSFNVGVSNAFSIGGGLELISTFGAGNPIFFITPKVGFKVSEKWHVGGGLLFASLPDFDSGRTGLGTLYGVGTYGSVDKNLTAGLGWGFIEGKFESSPIVTISGLTRIARKTALLTENWFVPGDNYTGIYSYGIRFFGDKLAVDLAFINNREIIQDIVTGIPYVDFVVKF